MADLRLEQIASQRMQQEQRQVLRMEQADLLELSEEEFHRLIAEVEKSPLFRRLYQRERLIHYQRLPGTGVMPTFYELKEDLLPASGSLDVESLLQNKAEVVRLIRKLGQEKFNRYFLFPEEGMTAEEIADECGLEVAEVEKINSLVDDFSIMSEFYHPSSLDSGIVHYSRVASIERDRQGFVVNFFSPLLARGRYVIDYERFEALKASAITEAEAKEARQLFRRMELVNSRKNTVSQILQNIIERQSLYLDSGNAQSLLPLSQKELAARLGMAPSSVSRAVKSRSIDTPWGEELPLKHFFPRPKRFRKELVRQLLESGGKFTSDEAIRKHLRAKFGVAISRRSVTNLRHELRFPAPNGKKH